MLKVGKVESFDDHVGTGLVESGGKLWLFHCTAIADASRTIQPGALVAFTVGAGGPGLWEAQQVTVFQLPFSSG